MKKIIVISIAIMVLFCGLVLYQFVLFNDHKLHLIFCDVGQGDAILIRTPNGKYILVDGGPDRKILDCLARHMPFWKREIDLIILTHPHADHFFGMFYVLERYSVKAFATEQLENKTTAYREALKGFAKKGVAVQYVLAGDGWDLGQVRMTVAGPTQDFIDQTSPGGTIGESKEFASIILHIKHGDFDALLTGDSQVEGLKEALPYLSGSIDVLQSPHHGSGFGLDETLLQSIAPAIAVVSVGAQNRYNHPHPKILKMYKDEQVPVLRTDLTGDVEIVSDGIAWEVRKGK